MALSEIQRDAARIVAACEDSGDAFDRRHMQSIEFANAVSDARLLRAYAPWKLRLAVQHPDTLDSLTP